MRYYCQSIFRSPFCIQIVFLLFLTQTGRAQISTGLPTLPSADNYVLKNWFGTTIVGPQLPFNEPAIKIFADDLELRDLNLLWRKPFRQADDITNTAKHIIIIANSIKIGANNSVMLESRRSPQPLRPGWSIILICRKLIFAADAQLRFTGTTGEPDFHFGNLIHEPSSYLGGFGSQLLIAAEKVEVDESIMQKLDTALFNTARRNLFSGVKHDAAIGRSLLVRDLVSAYKSFLPLEEREKCDDLLEEPIEESIKNDSSTVTIVLHLLDCQIRALKKNDVFAILTKFTPVREFIYVGEKSEGLIMSPERPYKLVSPLAIGGFDESFYHRIRDNVFPILISSSLGMRPVLKDTNVEVGYYPTRGISAYYYPQIPGNEVFGTVTGTDALRNLQTDNQKLFSQWAVEWIKYQKTQADQARLLGETGQFFNILRRVAEMPRYQLDTPYDDQYAQIDSQLLGFLSQAKDLVSTRSIVLDSPLAGQPVTVYTKGLPATYFLLPSDVLLSGVRSGDDWDCGIVQDITSPTPLKRFRLTVDLRIDPLLRRATDDKLNNLFGAHLEAEPPVNVSYDIQGITGQGIVGFRGEVTSHLAEITIDVDPGELEYVMFKWANTGLPFYLNWTIPGDPEQKGRIGPIFLRLSRRTGGQIHIDGRQITNQETNANATISYLRTSAGRIIPIEPLSLKAGASATLGNFDLAPEERLLDVPDMGIEYKDKDFANTIRRFVTMANSTVVDKITLTNKVPAIFTLPGSSVAVQVRNIEVDVLLMDTNVSTPRPIGHLILSPDGSDGSIQSLRLLHLANLTSTYRITGTANFSGGGSAPLKAKECSMPNIAITLDDLVLPGNQE